MYAEQMGLCFAIIVMFRGCIQACIAFVVAVIKKSATKWDTHEWLAMPKIVEANRKGQRKYKKKQDNMHLDILDD
jgi:hypothetical protein